MDTGYFCSPLERFCLGCPSKTGTIDAIFPVHLLKGSGKSFGIIADVRSDPAVHCFCGVILRFSALQNHISSSVQFRLIKGEFRTRKCLLGTVLYGILPYRYFGVIIFHGNQLYLSGAGYLDIYRIRCDKSFWSACLFQDIVSSRNSLRVNRQISGDPGSFFCFFLSCMTVGCLECQWLI